MRLGLRLLFAFFLVAGLAGFFALQVFQQEVEPSVREVIEDLLVDTANLVAEQAAPELRAMPPGATLQSGSLARELDAYRRRPVDAPIWGLRKRSLDLRIYVTDAAGRVVLDSAPGAATVRETPGAVGQDYSRWRDVSRTLRGQYGARATRESAGDDRSTVLYVAAPVRDGDRVIGVVTVAKPIAAVQGIIDRARRRVLASGLALLLLSSAVGVAVTVWMVASVRKLKAYATDVRAGERRAVPTLPGELGDLARAVDGMRERLEDRERLQHTVRALTHELKSPLSAIQGAAELLHDELPPEDRERFADQVHEQSQRLRDLVDRMLALSKLEGLQAVADPQAIPLLDLLDRIVAASAALATRRALAVNWLAREPLVVAGDPDTLLLLFSNLWSNALDFAPDDSTLDIALHREGAQAVFTLRDHGEGVPEFALPQLGERFFSMPRPRDGRRGTGLGLAIVRQAAALHAGRVAFEPARPGLRVEVRLPLS